jgi:NADPH-dependent 2,4-dienoyl-CoA reductase/sulfur reductase-like enzyme/rhodanese-related sulfurtransferase
MSRIIVVGGLSAGPSAAAKARRENEDAEIILFEKGANISYATCGIPYALSGVIENRKKLLVVKPDLMRERFNIDVRLEEEVLDVDVHSKSVITSKGEYPYDKLVFATGARSVVPPIKNLDKTANWSTCRSLQDYDKIIKEVIDENAEHVTVLGAGLIGVEVAENLIEAGKKVTLIEGADQILPMWDPKFSYFAKSALEEKGIEVITSTFVKAFGETNNQIDKVFIDEDKFIPTDFVIMSVGIKPNTDILIRKGAKHIGNGALIVNEKMETSLPGVYAAGDNVAIRNLQTDTHDYFPLGTHSNKGGRAAGANAAGADVTFKGAYKTAIVKVFDYTLARTGLNAKGLKEAGIPFKKSLSIAGATPGYYPGQKELITELYYHPETHELLGAEIFGEAGADKRIDVLSTAIYAKLKVTDLSQLDLAYAPPFAPAKDPVVVAGFVTENILEDKCAQMDINELEAYMEQRSREEYSFIDVRTAKEYSRGYIPGAVNIPLHDLRDRVAEIDATKPVILYCQKGLRGYLARLILKQKEINKIVSLPGGFKLWQMAGKKVVMPEADMVKARI